MNEHRFHESHVTALRQTGLSAVRIFALLCYLSVTKLTAAQPQEAALWTLIEMRQPIGKQWKVTLGQHVRFDQNLTQVSDIMPELSAQFRLCRYLRFVVGWRYIYARSGDDFVHRQRLHGDSVLRSRIGYIRLDYRLRLQEKIQAGSNRHTMRHRIRCRVKKYKRITPFLSAELSSRFGNKQGMRLHRWRATAGAELSLKHHELSMFYRHQDYIADPDASSLHIIGLAYSYEL